MHTTVRVQMRSRCAEAIVVLEFALEQREGLQVNCVMGYLPLLIGIDVLIRDQEGRNRYR